MVHLLIFLLGLAIGLIVGAVIGVAWFGSNLDDIQDADFEELEA